MVEERQDRLHFRNRDVVVAVVAGCAALLLPETSFSGEASRSLATFLGLLSASVLPTISLIIGSMNGAGRSVRAIGALRDELAKAMAALFLLFGVVAVAVLLLTVISLRPLSPVPPFVDTVGMTWAVIRGLLVYDIALGMSLALRVPRILLRCLELKHTIAVDEARRKIEERAPSDKVLSDAYATSPEFRRKRAIG